MAAPNITHNLLKFLNNLVRLISNIVKESSFYLYRNKEYKHLLNTISKLITDNLL